MIKLDHFILQRMMNLDFIFLEPELKRRKSMWFLVHRFTTAVIHMGEVTFPLSVKKQLIRIFFFKIKL